MIPIKSKLTQQQMQSLRNNGMPPDEIAQIAGVTKQNVYARTRPPEEVKRTAEKADALQLADVKAPQNTDDVVKDIVQKKKRVSHSPYTIETSSASSGEITDILNSVLRWQKATPVRTDEECATRLELFFNSLAETGELPTVEKMALALGVTRMSLWNWENGVKCSAARTEMIRRAKEILAAMDAELVSRNKIPQVTYIFRAKNFFGMKDQTDVVVTPNNPIGAEIPEEELRKRIEGDVVVDQDYLDAEFSE